MNKMAEIWSVLRWILLIFYLIIMMSFVKKERNTVICKNVEYSIDQLHHFVDTTDIYELLKSDSIYPKGEYVSQINLKKMEKDISEHHAIKDVQAFSEIDGTIHFSITQKEPIMRLITESNMQYYVDKQMDFMPVDFGYTADVPVLSGYLPDKFINQYQQSNNSDSNINLPYTLNDIVEFAKFIYDDELWRNQIVQIYINKNQEFELIPRVGKHIVILGDLENYDYKMKKLKAIYKKALPDFGWVTYKSINLKFANQVVCTK